MNMVLGGEIELSHPLAAPRIQATPSPAAYADSLSNPHYPRNVAHPHETSVKPYHTFLPAFDYEDLVQHLVKRMYPTIDHTVAGAVDLCFDGNHDDAMDLTSNDSTASSRSSSPSSYIAYIESLLPSPILLFVRGVSTAKAL